ncbi:hypothetical protein [Sandaracinus amylolyticus]|uniref:Uncharacterized protein n=1 Tax=Sandaracinus amylolyticus TaxID=927083 RepID=A0A0F6W2H4_9BACT|nr:hypothetical protein [Sandaracinus amylolyticus]AKF05577.1 hypothetical protein DB32_002726 [Sandaracinus amylolyticus]
MERDLAGRCGSCSFFISYRETEDGAQEGECRLGCWVPPLRDDNTCSHFKQRGTSFDGALKRKVAAGTPRRMREEEARASEPKKPLPQEIDIDMDQDEFRRVLREVLLEELGVGDVAMGDRWRGGEMILKPGKDGTQPKSVPLDQFFHKIVMLRDKLRVLEQKVNSSKGLADDEKVQLQQYITACYGSLTTFNALFRDREDYFVGQGTKE